MANFRYDSPLWLVNRLLWPLTLFAVICFTTLFVGLELPEILRANYVTTACKVLSYQTTKAYHCATEDCQCRESRAPTCKRMISYLERAFSPETCIAKDVCPGTQACSNGYMCCQECCGTCSSCDADGNCYSYSCNCWCCDSVSNHRCDVACEIYLSGDMVVVLADTNTTARVVLPFGTNVAASQVAETKYAQNNTVVCYHHPTDYYEIVFDVGYTAWKWVVTTLFGIVPLAVCLGVFFVRVDAHLCVRSLYRRARNKVGVWATTARNTYRYQREDAPPAYEKVPLMKK